MNLISLLRRETSGDLTPEEDAALANALSAAYHMDETAASSREVQRIGEKVRARIKELSDTAAADSSTPEESMNLLTPSFNILRQQHPCPNCRTPVSVDVITKIESEEVLNRYLAEHLNRAQCSYCGALVEAAVRVRVSLSDSSLVDHECVPLALLDRPEILEDILQDSSEGLKRVYSNDELERSIEASLLIELHRRGQLPGEGNAVDT